MNFVVFGHLAHFHLVIWHVLAWQFGLRPICVFMGRLRLKCFAQHRDNDLLFTP